MSFEIVLFIIIPIFILMIVIIIFGRKHKSSLQMVFENLALKYNGSFKKSFFYPSLEFSHENCRVKVYIQPGGRNSPPFTHAVVFLSLTQNIKMRLYHESVFSRFGKKIGMQDIQVCNEEFDNTFMIKGSDEYLVSQILNFDIQNKLLECKNIPSVTIPIVSLNSKKLDVYVPQALRTEGEINYLIEVGLKITDRLKDVHLIDYSLGSIEDFKKTYR